MRFCIAVLAILLIGGAAPRAQVVPAVNGPKPLSFGGTLHYDLRYSETAQYFDSSIGNEHDAVVSGELTYANSSESRPFGTTYSGGNIWNISGKSYGTGVFQHLQMSQGFIRRNWSLNLSDDVSYLPQAPTTGFSGVAGVGNLPSQPGEPSQTLLTLNTHTLYNNARAGFQGRLNYAWSVGIGGSSQMLRYVDNNSQKTNGQDTNILMTDALLNRRIDAKNSVFAQCSHTRNSYQGTDYTFSTDSAMFGAQRQWNRKLSTAVSAGPVWIFSSGISNSAGSVSPNLTMYSVTASANYQMRGGGVAASYVHGTNSGAGYLLGGKIDNASAGYSRDFGKNLSLGATGSYMRTTSLMSIQFVVGVDGKPEVVAASLDGINTAKFGGVQATRRLGRFMNAFASYTAIGQGSSMRISSLGYNANLLNGLEQAVSFGIGYSPREIHFRK